MARTTVDFGIDLGTTNSEIASLEGTEIRVYKNNKNHEATPSAVYIDEKDRIHVGETALERVEDDPENAKSEFKRLMGARESLRFANAGRNLTPVELSAEVLKSLREDVFQRTGEEIDSAVITVPAMFELPASEATRKAAELAGIRYAPLLQEPIAAALAYGFQEDGDKRAFWLVYDLGGGTFDAALISVRDGALTVADHAGDNHLGGKDLDWAIADIVTKRLQSEYALSNMSRESPRYRSVYAKLKGECERAKIDLSRSDAVQIKIEDLCADEKGRKVFVECEITKAQLTELMTPDLIRTVNICRNLLERNHLSTGDIDRMALVGGPTLSPILRKYLKDELGIRADYRVDPITVVAQGAAIFAGTLKSTRASSDRERSAYAIDLQYDPITQETEPFAGGKVTKSDTGTPPPEGFALEFQRSDEGWSSGKIPLRSNGVFITNLRIRERKPNEFLIRLYDQGGLNVSVSPEKIKITHGLTVSAPPLARSLGLKLADNTLRIYLEKGRSLPAKHKAIHLTTKSVQSGSDDDALFIPVMEGEYPRADRNHHVGTLVIPGSKFRRDLPAKSEVEVTIEIDESRIVTTRAYIPFIEFELEKVIELETFREDPEALRNQLEAERERLRKAQQAQKESYDPEVNQLLERIELERMIDEIQEDLRAALGDDPAARLKAQNRIHDLQAILDDVDRRLEWPRVEKEIQDELNYTRVQVRESGDDQEKKLLALMEKEISQAIQQKDVFAIKSLIEELIGLRIRIASRDPAFWIEMLNSLETDINLMSDTQSAKRLIEQGRKAIRENKLSDLQNAVRSLIKLLPANKRDSYESSQISTIQ